MKAIIVCESEMDRIEQAALNRFKYEKNFMYDSETTTDYKKTKRCEIVELAKKAIKESFEQLRKSDFGE